MQKRAVYACHTLLFEVRIDFASADQDDSRNCGYGMERRVLRFSRRGISPPIDRM